MSQGFQQNKSAPLSTPQVDLTFQVSGGGPQGLLSGSIFDDGSASHYTLEIDWDGDDVADQSLCVTGTTFQFVAPPSGVTSAQIRATEVDAAMGRTGISSSAAGRIPA